MECLKELTFNTSGRYCQTSLPQLRPQDGSLGNGPPVQANVAKVILADMFFSVETKCLGSKFKNKNV